MAITRPTAFSLADRRTGKCWPSARAIAGIPAAAADAMDSDHALPARVPMTEKATPSYPLRMFISR